MYRDAAVRLQEVGLRSEGAVELLNRIVAVGPRLTGSPQADEAVAVCVRIMEELGFDRVRTEPVTVRKWVRRAERASVIGADGGLIKELKVAALGGSVATPPEGLEADLVEVRSLQELERLGDEARGKVVFFNRPMDRAMTDAFAAYGAAADQRVRGASAAAAKGALAVLVRSLTFRQDDYPHTGMLVYDERSNRIPAAAVSTNDADFLSGLIKSGRPVRVHLNLDCEDLGQVVSANVLGELTGSELPDEVVLVGGHLDSWDLGLGAHDDAAGCAASVEALRLIKACGLKPKRTIRAVMFMDEEFGGTGGRHYAAAPERKGEKHLLAMESDRGGFLPLGLAVGGSDRRLLAKVRRFEALFRPLGVLTITGGGGGVDVGPLVAAGARPASVITNAQPYFDVHHSALDVPAAVHPREFELQAVIMALLAYIISMEGT
jgi:Zn-dependent M28 family amino/carboxypeptidase